jgi:NAD(P)H dehydrogenase (quinone)
MNVFIVLAHPEPKSFNGALTATAEEHLKQLGHEVVVSDLYKMNWNPVSDRSNFISVKDPSFFKQQLEELHASETDGFPESINKEMEKLFWCDVLIFQFPMWWYTMPAILKGWVDRALPMGKIYGDSKFYDTGVFLGKKAMVSITIGAPASVYSPTGIGGHLDQLLFPIQRGIFSFIGFEVLPPFVVWEPARIGDKRRKVYLQAYRERLSALETTTPLYFPPLSAYDQETLNQETKTLKENMAKGEVENINTN